MKYVKKPQVVEVFRYGYDDPPDWFLSDNNCVEHEDKESGYIDIGSSFILNFSKGDMIIKSVKGEIYPCKKDIFDETYEPYREGE